jgi:anti-sigma-K factor RskA
MSDQGPELPQDDALAAEHALGVLNARERAGAEARMASDPAFAAEVEAWGQRLAPMLGDIAPVAPPADLWSRIERGLPVNDNDVGVRGRLRFWRGATAGSLALAAASLAVAVMLAVRPPEIITAPQPPMEPMLNARLAGTTGEPMFLAAYDPERKAVMVASLMPPGADPNHSHQLWLIPADGRPRSLGLVAPGASKAMPVSDRMAAMVTEGAGLAVTVEPLGGSTGENPSGPMAAEGRLARI